MLNKAINKLLEHLPSSPNPILIVSQNLNEWTPVLTQPQVTFIHFSEWIKLKADDLQAEAYGTVVVHLSLRLSHSLALFHQIHDLLTDDGKIWLITEVSLQKMAEDTDESLPYIAYIIAHAQRCGFQLKQQIELATVGDATRLHHRLMGLEWIKGELPRWRMAVVTPEEKDDIITLFNQVFKPNQMDATFWEWKYGQGRGLGILAWHENQLVAHYGGIVREIRYFGQAKLAVQITDVMVDVKERGVLTRQGAFFLMTATFLENYIGYGAKTWIGYGFPSYRHVKLAQHLGLYATVGEMIELRWPVITDKSPRWTQLQHLPLQAYLKKQPVVNQLWAKMATTLSQALVGIRDWSYLYHRYYCHPNKRYELLLLSRRFIRQALVIIVIDRDQDVCKIMDFIGDIRFIPEAIHQIRCSAGKWGFSQVQLWITQNFLNIFPLEQAEQHRLGIYIPHNIWAHSFSPTLIENRWWLMAGDTDFL